jgi:hypothetical protein
LYSFEYALRDCDIDIKGAYSLRSGNLSTRGEIMITVHQEYLMDEEGRRKAIVLPIAEWEQILEALEELEGIRAHDEAKQCPSDQVPFDQAVAEIREGKVP